MDGWSIPTAKLTGARRLGGRTSRRGHFYQDAYTCLQLICLLDAAKGVLAVRPEGAQDVDLLYADGHEECIQLKNEPRARYTIAALAPILRSFALDLLEAGRSTTLRFILVARSNDLDAAARRLEANRASGRDVNQLADLLGRTTRASAAPPRLTKLNDKDRRSLVQQLLGQTTFWFGMGDEVAGHLSFESHAMAELGRHGIAGPDLGTAFNTLKAALDRERELTPRHVWQLLKGFIVSSATDAFGGRVEVLTDDLLSHPAQPDRVRGFYAGLTPLGWDIIAANGDIDRDQLNSLLTLLVELPDSFRLICLVAEPGAGKSTLAWRAAANLHRQQGALVLRVKDSMVADIWYGVEAFAKRIDRPLCIVADDLLRSPDVIRALREIDGALPLTVLATCRANEDRPVRLKGEFLRVPLEEPSRGEKERALEKLGKKRDDLTADQRKRLDNARQFLPMMMEVTGGKGREDIIRDVLDRLRTVDEFAYRAYEYVSFADQHSVGIPRSLLERLDSEGRYHNLPERKAAQGLIFYDQDRSVIRTGHPIVAEVMAGVYAELRAPATVVRELVNAVDSSQGLERRFVARLLRALAQAKSRVLDSVLPDVNATVTACQYSADGASELSVWRSFYLALGEHGSVKRVSDLALQLVPGSAVDCEVLCALYRERGRERDALPALAEAIRQNPDLHGGPSYLGLVERYGSEGERAAAVSQTVAWLRRHPEDTYVRTRSIGFIERSGTRDQADESLEETSAWLRQHPGDTSVRATYLGFAERQGTSAQVERVLQDTRIWLEQHLEDSVVRTASIGLVERHGTPAERRRALIQIGSWLKQHGEDVPVRERFLGLAERYATPAQFARVLRNTREWLKDHPYDVNVRSTYIGLVERRGTINQISRVLRESRSWLSEHPDAKEISRTVISALFRLGRIEEAAKIAEEAISRHPNDQSTIGQYIFFFRNTEDEQKIKAMYENLVAAFPRNVNIAMHFADWLRDHEYADEAAHLYQSLVKRAPRHFGTAYGFGVLLLRLGQVDEAAEQFRKVLEVHKGHVMAHFELARTLCEQGSRAKSEGREGEAGRLFAQAEGKFRDAIYWSFISGQPRARFYARLGWLYIERTRFGDALWAFQSARREAPDYFESYWGAGRALVELRQFGPAADALRAALEKAPTDLRPPASEEIPALLADCEAHLSY